MITKYLEKMTYIYNTMDSVLITNIDGIIEYCAVFDEKDSSIKNEGYTGKYLLEVYPELTKETSTHFRAMKTGKAIIDEIQTVIDFNGIKRTFVSNTYPIEVDGKIVGAIEGTVILSDAGLPNSKRFKDSKVNTESGLYTIDDLIGKSNRMLVVKEKILRAADGDSSVMIIGETGTGKEIVAQAIHSHSKRKNQAFISQNCSAIPASLLESTLFGTVKGSYTGAEDRKGLFELADKGTLFLDELNSMNIELQGKILKAVEEQKIRRLGSEKERKIDVRIISALNEEVDEVLEKDKIRKDLYYRLGVFQINLPLLKDRKEDIPLLIKYFINYYNKKGKRNIENCSELAERLLIDYEWPGNVRELKNVIEYAFNMSKGKDITMTSLPENFLYNKKEDTHYTEQLNWEKALEEGHSLASIIDNYESRIIKKILSGSSNITEAADKLGVSRQVLNYKIKKYQIKF
ncbi:sigma-54 interaction domain-containing protein [Aminipila terrae]|uniref:AAA domain-containing protein n=1 Tax=Aminipila terrae TaxID=2697030 RepID=A0A6P1MIS5_9FIRM|nr:sigma 54-interacting transcriptional regulator [Aminipila terrae]QHI72514.1 AAA domain-containing protein [Aminipila terrae]